MLIEVWSLLPDCSDWYPTGVKSCEPLLINVRLLHLYELCRKRWERNGQEEIERESEWERERERERERVCVILQATFTTADSQTLPSSPGVVGSIIKMKDSISSQSCRMMFSATDRSIFFSLMSKVMALMSRMKMRCLIMSGEMSSSWSAENASNAATNFPQTWKVCSKG